MAEVKQNSRSKKFIKDFGIYAIGNLGSKLITFLMIPLYTYFVEKPKDYGYYDLCLQICFLLVPIVTLQIRDAAFRYLLVTDSEERKKQIISFTLNSFFVSLAVTSLLAFIVSSFRTIPYFSYVIALLFMLACVEVFVQIARGLGQNKVFVTSNLICTFGIGVFSILFVAILSMGIKGIFLANIVARLFSLAYCEFKLRLFQKYYSFKFDYNKVGRELLKFSLPLIPVALCWWVTSSSNRLFIKEFLGLEIAGIYAVSARLVSIFQNIGIIFYQTWQENAIQQYKSDDRDSFFSKVFNSYAAILTCLFIFYVFILKHVYPIIVSNNYQEGFEYLYLLGISAMLYTLTSYFELGYQCANDTKRAVTSIVLTALIAIGLNYYLIRHYGIYGIIISSILSYLFLFIYRYFETKRYFKLSLSKNLILYLILVVIGGIVYSKNLPFRADAIFLLVAAVVYAKTLPIKELKEKLLKRRKRTTA